MNMNKPKHPCPPQCPDRSGECKITCEKWQEYEVEHSNYLNEKTLEKQRSLDISDHVRDTIKRYKRGNSSKHQRERNR